jgi:hypothetical protein
MKLEKLFSKVKSKLLLYKNMYISKKQDREGEKFKKKVDNQSKISRIQQFKKTKYYIKPRNMIKNVYDFVIHIPLDFIFVFFASFILTINYELWERLLFSIGITYIVNQIKKFIEGIVASVMFKR